MPLAKNGKLVLFLTERKQILHLSSHSIKSGETAKLSARISKVNTRSKVYQEAKRCIPLQIWSFNK